MTRGMRVSVATCLALAFGWAVQGQPDDPGPAPSQRPRSAPGSLPATMPEPPRPIRTLGDPAFRHDSNMTCMLALPGGRRVLTSGRDGSVRLWDLRTGSLLRRYDHDKRETWDLALLPDGKRFASAGDGSVILWDLESGQRLREFPHGKHQVFRLAVDSTGTRLAAGDIGNRCILWNIETGQEIARLTKHGNSVYTVQFDRQDTRLYTGSNDSSIERWDIATGDCVLLKAKDPKPKSDTQPADPNQTGPIYTLAPSPDRGRFLVCCASRSPWMMDAEGKELWRAKDVPDSYCAAWSPNGEDLAVVANPRELCVLSAKDGSKRWSTSLPSNTHYGVAYGAEGKEVLCGLEHALWRFDAGSGKRVYPAPGAPVQCSSVDMVAPLPKGLLVEVGSGPGVRVYDRRSGRVKATFLEDRHLDHAAVSKDGKVLARDEGTMLLIDPLSGEKVREWGAESWGEQAITADGRFAMMNLSAGLTVWRTDNGRVHWNVSEDYIEPIRAIRPGRASQVAALAEDKIRILDLAEKEVVQVLSGPKFLQDCTFLPGDPPALISWTYKEVQLWLPRAGVPDEPLAAEQVRKLLADLGAERFRDRDQATRRLVAAGQSVLPHLKSFQPRDAEQAARLAQVEKEILRQMRYGIAGRMPLVVRSFAGGIASHPDGRHWVLVGEPGQPPRRVQTIERPGGLLRGLFRPLVRETFRVSEEPEDVGESKGPHVIIGRVEGNRLSVCLTFRPAEVPQTAAFDEDGILIVGNANGTISEYDLRAWLAPAGTGPSSAP